MQVLSRTTERTQGPSDCACAASHKIAMWLSFRTSGHSIRGPAGSLGDARVLPSVCEMWGRPMFGGMTAQSDVSRDELFEIGLDAVIAGIKTTMGISSAGS